MSPQGNSRSSSPRAARSHSSSVGSRIRPGVPSRSPSQRQYAVAASQVTPVTGWSTGASGEGRPVARANAAHRPTVTCVRAIRNAGTRTRLRGASLRYHSTGTPVRAYRSATSSIASAGVPRSSQPSGTSTQTTGRQAGRTP